MSRAISAAKSTAALAAEVTFGLQKEFFRSLLKGKFDLDFAEMVFAQERLDTVNAISSLIEESSNARR